jgi:YD repeat-containing protein
VYDYDHAGQLLRRSAEGFDEERFTWDAAGNLLDDEGWAANEKIAPLLDNLLREYHGVRYEYDEWGQLVRRNSMALGWDAEGHARMVGDTSCIRSPGTISCSARSTGPTSRASR